MFSPCGLAGRRGGRSRDWEIIVKSEAAEFKASAIKGDQILKSEGQVFREPDVHSLLVTRVIVGNHRTRSTRPYNYVIPQPYSAM